MLLFMIMKWNDILIKQMNQYFLLREYYMRKHATIQLYLSYRCSFVMHLIDE